MNSKTGNKTLQNVYSRDYLLNFTNKEIDYKLDLHYFGARYYTADFPRFISPDPVSGKLETPITWNRYLYCANDPINYIDPDGREAIAFAAFMAYCSRLNTGFIAGMAAGYVTNQLTSGNTDKQQSFNATISGGTGNLLGNTIPIPILSSIVSGVSQTVIYYDLQGHNVTQETWEGSRVDGVISVLSGKNKPTDVFTSDFLWTAGSSVVAGTVGDIASMGNPILSNIFSTIANIAAANILNAAEAGVNIAIEHKDAIDATIDSLHDKQ